MESESSQEYKKLESEITKGMEQVKQLRASSSGNKETVLGIMLASYEEALEILRDVASEGPPPDKPGSSVRVSKRKAVPTWKRRVEVTVTSVEDGYAWRKYGQKEILGSRQPRCYFRCTHKFDQGCKAMKQTQMVDDDPSVCEITYTGTHTCEDQVL